MSEKGSHSSSEQFNRIIAELLRQIDLGEQPDTDALCKKHPELADELRVFLADQSELIKTKQRHVEPTILSDGTTPDGIATPPVDPKTIVTDSTILQGTSAKKAKPIEPNTRHFGDYELIQEIARGGMGVVYRAKQSRLNRVVAVKMILAGRLASEQDVQRFYQEAEAAAHLDHPGIVPIFEVGEHEGQHYFSMGFVDGPTLAAKLDGGFFSPIASAGLVIELANAVQYAHDQGVVHRDLKPSNILLDDNGHPRITDFGLAKKLQVDSDLTGTGQILGTPSYMPPEQAAGRMSEIGSSADIYSLGAILYCLLTGQPPFRADNPMETLRQVLEEEPVAPRQRITTIPRELNTICMKCLSKDPAKRYSTARELSEDLQRFLDGDAILAKPLGPVGRLRRWTKQRQVMSGCISATVGLVLLVASIASAASAVALVGSIGYAFFEDRSTPDATFTLDEEDAMSTPPFPLEAEALNALDLKMQVRSSSFKLSKDESESDGDDTDGDEKTRVERDKNAVVEAMYNFEVNYTIFDEEGVEVHSDSSRVVWNSSLRRNEGVKFDPESNWVTLNTINEIGKFRAPSSGDYRVFLEVEPDQVYNAQADSIELRVHENVRDGKGMSLSAGALCCGSPLLFLVGLVLLIYGPFLMSVGRAKSRYSNAHVSR